MNGRRPFGEHSFLRVKTESGRDCFTWESFPRKKRGSLENILFRPVKWLVGLRAREKKGL